MVSWQLLELELEPPELLVPKGRELHSTLLRLCFMRRLCNSEPHSPGIGAFGGRGCLWATICSFLAGLELLDPNPAPIQPPGHPKLGCWDSAWDRG